MAFRALRATSQGLFHYDVRIIKITIWIRVVVRIWVLVRVMVVFFLKTLLSCICLNFNGSEFHAGTIVNCE
jgi:uncharacterized membrane protein